MVVDDEEFCISAMKAMMGLLGIDIEHHVDFCING
jgi:CheY-like chemotaxis protein